MSGSGSQKRRSKSSGKKKMQWDENNLEQNQAYLDASGPRMKIDEPKTPYEGLTPEEARDKDAFANAMANKLASTDWEDDEGRTPAATKEAAKKEDFEEKRKKHYNEFQMVKAMREGKLKPDDV